MHLSLLLSNTTSVEVINTKLLFLFTLFELVSGHAQYHQIVSENQHIPVVMVWNHARLFLNFFNRMIKTVWSFLIRTQWG